MIGTNPRRAAASVAAALLLAGCGNTASPAQTSPSDAVTGGITVLAAASLTDAFQAIATDFERAHPGTEVTFSFGSSATLATQINQGAPADVFAAANEPTMRTVTDAGAAQHPQIFVTNTLEIAVPRSNPGNITGLADFADPAKKIAVCAPQVPCGAAAQRVFAHAGVTARPDTLESDVKALLQKVQLDEVDAALVYHTDVVAAGDAVEGITFAAARTAVNRYPIATLTGAPNPGGAAAFVDHVLSPLGQARLDKAGFARP